jgi:AraC-like DNA-binding protein
MSGSVGAPGRQRPGATRPLTVAEVAEQVGYSSASTFSVAFTRHVGLPPTHHAREQAELRRP